MDFLRSCAASLDAGTSAEVVMARMRERYTTVRCLNVKTCLVRQMCAPSPDFVQARDALLDATEDATERARLTEALETGLWPADLRATLSALPHRLPANVYALRVTRPEMRACKTLGIRSTLEKNRRRVCVSGRALLADARRIVASPSSHDLLDVAMALMLVTGRRTCEVLNGRSSFDALDDHALSFAGQAKKRGRAEAYHIPTLAPTNDILKAFDDLRLRQDAQQLTNAKTSLRYQRPLSLRLAARAPLWSQVGCIHGLRGTYACMCLRLFDWGDASDAFVAMCILGHRGVQESLVYTPFALGDDFGDEPRLGRGHMTEPPVITAGV